MNDRLPMHWPLLLVVLAIACQGSSNAQPQDATKKEIYQDFRGATALRDEFRLRGPDVKTAAKFEPGGLRVTLPAARPNHFPCEVCTNFSLFGDFEVTGTYELLSVTQPTEGYGVGVALIVADADKRDKFIKVSRLMRQEKGSVYVSEFWTRYPPKDYKLKMQPTEVRTGQLRLERTGTRLRCLVADEVGKDFSVVFERPDFGGEELAHVRFEVADGNKPNNPVDVRLLDWRIRMETFPQNKVLAPDGPAPRVVPVDDPVLAPAQSPRRGWLIALLVAGLGFTILLTGAVALFLFVRQRNEARNS